MGIRVFCKNVGFKPPADTRELTVRVHVSVSTGDHGGASGASCFGATGRWTGPEEGCLHVPVISPTFAGQNYTLSFSLINPPRPQIAPPPPTFIAAAGAGLHHFQLRAIPFPPPPSAPPAEGGEERGGEVGSHGDWYSTFSIHLQRQYPSLFKGGGGGDGGGEGELLAGISREWRIRAARQSQGGGLRIVWGDVGGEGSVVVVQVAQCAPGGAAGPYRLVYAGMYITFQIYH